MQLPGYPPAFVEKPDHAWLLLLTNRTAALFFSDKSPDHGHFVNKMPSKVVVLLTFPRKSGIFADKSPAAYAFVDKIISRQQNRDSPHRAVAENCPFSAKLSTTAAKNRLFRQLLALRTGQLPKTAHFRQSCQRRRQKIDFFGNFRLCAPGLCRTSHHTAPPRPLPHRAGPGLCRKPPYLCAGINCSKALTTFGW